MIVPRDLIAKISDGRKTMNRVPVDPELAEVLPDDFEDLIRRHCPWNVDTKDVSGVYSVRPAWNVKTWLHVRVTAIRVERLGAIAPEEAIAEGFKWPREFFDHWARTYGDVDRDALVWVVEFEKAAAPPRYLARPVPKRHGEYTTTKAIAIDDAEVIDGAALDRMAIDNRVQYWVELLKRGDRADVAAIKSTLNSLRIDANSAGYNIHSDLRAIEKRLEAIQRKMLGSRAA